ncbi:MAG: DMT family transporter [Candidatus Muirbacterium halophilum]|nr:DMT family transporter [Candidatus Muirbacterium halophilum]MCK9475994.1 DMT family transporter [Candidatus Muirbacterium halophilum]
MIYLITAVLLSVFIANVLKYSSQKKTDVIVIFFGNYLFAAIFSWFLISPEEKTILIKLPELITGLATGVFFLVNFFLYMHNIKLNGMSISVSVMRISVVIPVVFSILLFGEKIDLLKVSGIIIILLSFYLSGKKDGVNAIKWILILFVCTGLTDTCLKFYNFYYGDNISLFLFYVFSWACLVNLGIIIFKNRKIDFKSLFFGIFLGIPNQLTSLYFMKALEVEKAVIVYPVFASSVVIFSVLSDIIFWKTKYSLIQKMYFAVMIIGIVLLNIKI